MLLQSVINNQLNKIITNQISKQQDYKSNLVRLLNELKNIFPYYIIIFLFFGLIVLPLICICYLCLRKLFRSKNIGLKSKAKINKSTINLKQPVVSTSALRSATMSQNEETISVTNIQIDNDLFGSLSTKQKDNKIKQITAPIDKQKQFAILPNKDDDSQNTQSLDKNTKEELSLNHLSMFTKTLPDDNKLSKNKSLLINYQIDDKARQRIKNYIKSNPDRVIKFKKHHKKKITKKISKSTQSEQSKDNLSKINNRKENGKKERKSKIRNRSSRKKLVDNRKKQFKSTYLSKRSSKSRLLDSKINDDQIDKIQIFNKSIKLNQKSNELSSIFKNIPSLSDNKIPSIQVLYSPPSINTLKTGRQIPIDLSSRSSSEELIFKNIQKFKKSKLKTKSTQPLLDGHFL